MTRDPLKYRLVTERTGQILDLFDMGLSFKLMLKWKLLPPLPILNDFLRCGRDDLDDKDGILFWKPFQMSPNSLKSLVSLLSARGKNVTVDTSNRPGVRTYDDWFSANIAERESTVKRPRPRR